MVEQYVERVHTEHAVLDIGEDIGALVIYTQKELRGKQIDVSPKGHDWYVETNKWSSGCCMPFWQKTSTLGVKEPYSFYPLAQPSVWTKKSRTSLRWLPRPITTGWNTAIRDSNVCMSSYLNVSQMNITMLSLALVMNILVWYCYICI